jgi:hypothetical protein
MEQLLADVEEQISSGEEEFPATFGSAYCLEVTELADGPLHIPYRLDNGDTHSFELTAAYLGGLRLEGRGAELAATVGRTVVASEGMEDYLG